MQISPLRFAMAVAVLGVFVATLTAAEPDGLDWQSPSEKLKLSFKDDTPIVFVSRNQLAEWETLTSYWNAATETTADPRTGQMVTRSVVKIKLPLGINPPQTPAENPMTLAKFILGKRLYFDPVLSSDGAVSCASCHSPVKGFTDQMRFSIGIGGLHDGSEDTLEKVVEFYDRGGNINEFLDTKMRDFEAERKVLLGEKLNGVEVKLFGKDNKPVIPLKLNLTSDEKKDLVLFLKSLQGAPIDSMVADPKKLPAFPGGAN